MILIANYTILKWRKYKSYEIFLRYICLKFILIGKFSSVLINIIAREKNV